MAVPLRLFNLWIKLNLRWLPQQQHTSSTIQTHNSVNFKDAELKFGVEVAEGHQHTSSKLYKTIYGYVCPFSSQDRRLKLV